MLESRDRDYRCGYRNPPLKSKDDHLLACALACFCFISFDTKLKGTNILAREGSPTAQQAVRMVKMTRRKNEAKKYGGATVLTFNGCLKGKSCLLGTFRPSKRDFLNEMNFIPPCSMVAWSGVFFSVLSGGY